MDMHKISVLTVTLLVGSSALAQRTPEKMIDKSLITQNLKHLGKDVMTPEKLWELGRVSAEGLSADGKILVYGVSNYSFDENKSEKNLFVIPVSGGEAKPFTVEAGGESVVEITGNGDVIYLFKGQLWSKNLNGGDAKKLTDVEGGLENAVLSPDKKHILFSRAVLIKKYHSKDRYEDLPKSDVYIYDDLDYRHWDTFNDGRFNHPF